jgi:hypothetical protein
MQLRAAGGALTTPECRCREEEPHHLRDRRQGERKQPITTRSSCRLRTKLNPMGKTAGRPIERLMDDSANKHRRQAVRITLFRELHPTVRSVGAAPKNSVSHTSTTAEDTPGASTAPSAAAAANAPRQRQLRNARARPTLPLYPPSLSISQPPKKTPARNYKN